MNNYYVFEDDGVSYKISINEVTSIEVGADGEILITNEDDFVFVTNKLELVKEYGNNDKKCECSKCELNNTCKYKDKFLRLARKDGGLGLCEKL